MRKLIVFTLAVLTVFMLAACSGSSGAAKTAASGKDYEGGWYDVVSKRCGMEIKAASDNEYNVKVSWGSGAYETAEWIMTAEFDDSDGTLRYTDGKKQIVCYDTEDSVPVYDVIYTDSTGFFKLENDRIYWSDEKDHESSDSRLFLGTYEYEDYPADIKYMGFYYRDEDASSAEVYYDKGVIMVNIDITRLASMSGSAYYDSEKDALIAEVTDPSENPMELILKKTDGGLTVTVIDSTWDYIQNGDVFDFS